MSAEHSMIGAVVLAAGSSKRFGADKRQSILPNGQMLLVETIQNVSEIIDQVFVTLRVDDQRFSKVLDRQINNTKVTYFCASDSAKGMGHSLANASQAIPNWDAALVFLGDMPFVKKETVACLLQEYERRKKSCAPIVVPTIKGKRGHPVLFCNRYFNDLGNLLGDQGAKSILDANKHCVFELEVTDEGVVKDIDEPADLTR